MTALAMSLRAFQEMLREGVFQQTLVGHALSQVLLGLNFLHVADVIHTGEHPAHSNSSFSASNG